MGRIAFVAWMYVMSAASVVIALGDRSWKWFIGAVIFFVVAQAARKLLKEEHESEEPTGPRLGFVGMAMVGMLAVMAILFWFQFSA